MEVNQRFRKNFALINLTPTYWRGLCSAKGISSCGIVSYIVNHEKPISASDFKKDHSMRWGQFENDEELETGKQTEPGKRRGVIPYIGRRSSKPLRARRLLVTKDYGLHYVARLNTWNRLLVTTTGDWILRLWLILTRLWTRGFRLDCLVTICLGSDT